MTIEIEREKLMQCLSTVANTVPKVTPLPVYTCILMQCINGILRISSSNMKAVTSSTIELEQKETFFAAVPFDTFSKLVESTDSAMIALTYNIASKNMFFDGGTVRANIKCLPAEDFQIPAAFTKELFSIPIADFIHAVAHTSFSASEQSFNTILMGVYFASEGDHVVMVATDSYRFSVQRLAIQAPKPFKTIIPFKALEDAAKLATEGSILFAVENDKAMFKCGNSEMICLQIDGAYLDYTQLEGMKTKEPLAYSTLKTQDLRRACKQAAIFAGEKQIVTIDIQPVFTQISAQSDQTGDGVSTVAGQGFGSDKISLNGKYMEQVLAAIETEQTRIDILGKGMPIVFSCSGKTDFYHVIMPFAT